VVSDYLVSRLTNLPVIIAAMPRVQDGKVKSIVVASLDIRWLGRIAGEEVAHSSADVLLMDRAGTIIAAYPDAQDWVGRSLAESSLWPALTGPGGAVESAGLDGEPRMIGHARLPETGAILAVARERDDILSDANRKARLALMKIAGAAAFCFLVVWLGGERLVLRAVEQLTAGARRIGSHDLSARVKTEGFAPELRILGDTFNQMAAQLSQRELELQRAHQRLTELASTDGLTGLANRRRFDEHIDAEWRRSMRTGEGIALLTFDVDHFKKFNDRYGHLEGDTCLIEVAGAIAAAARRPPDLAARTGGEEFALVLPGASLPDAAGAAERIRAAVAALEIAHTDGQDGRVTVSIGVAATTPRPGDNVRTLMRAADAALYRAKRGGRNQVVADVPTVALAS
jgi:diguanylate cyclase (GGDEF)-like protein